MQETAARGMPIPPDTEDVDVEAPAFTTLGLPVALTDELSRHGVTTAFPIQARTIPDALSGRDVLGKARTGSGKTLAFGLPTAARLEGSRARPKRPLALVLVPTRELAMQVADALRPYAAAAGLGLLAVFGGAGMDHQIFALGRGVEMLVATPGRLSDLIGRGACTLEDARIVVLDEADEMADMGFLPDVCALLDQVPAEGQRLLFSATLDGEVDQIVSRYLTDPVRHAVVDDPRDSGRMTHHVLIVDPRHKAPVTAEIAARHRPGDSARTLLFVRTKMAVDRVAGQLRDAGLPAAGLHGGMSQRARTRTLAEFREGRRPVLVATNVAARGIHVDGVDLVVHLDPSNQPKDYLHRAGRTARAGESGAVATIVLPRQRKATFRLLDEAGVSAETVRVAPGHDDLVRLTGARPVDECVAELTAYQEQRRELRARRSPDRDTERRARPRRPERWREDRVPRPRLETDERDSDRRPRRDADRRYSRSGHDRYDRPRYDSRRFDAAGGERAGRRDSEAPAGRRRAPERSRSDSWSRSRQDAPARRSWRDEPRGEDRREGGTRSSEQRGWSGQTGNRRTGAGRYEGRGWGASAESGREERYAPRRSWRDGPSRDDRPRRFEDRRGGQSRRRG